MTLPGRQRNYEPNKEAHPAFIRLRVHHQYSSHTSAICAQGSLTRALVCTAWHRSRAHTAVQARTSWNAAARPDMGGTEDLSKLPGDPGLFVFTNVDLGERKMETMKALSGMVAKCLGKPEKYVAVCIMVLSVPLS